MKKLKQVPLIFLIVFISIGLACNKDTSSLSDNSQEKKDKPINLVSNGGKIFTSSGNCSSCHGANGKPTITVKDIPDFTDPAWHRTTTDAEIMITIKNGKGIMPKYSGPESDIPDLIAYIRSLKKQ